MSIPLEQALKELAADPSRPVRARVGKLTVELRAVSSEDEAPAARTVADVFRALGPWEGETAEELAARLARDPDNQRDVPTL